MRGVAAVALLLGLAAAAAVWAARPFQDLPEVVPQAGGGAAQAGGLILVAGVLLLIAVAAALVWAARRDLDRALRLVLRAAIAFGLLLLLVPFVLRVPVPAYVAWPLAAVAAGETAWLLRRRGWRSDLAAALAAGGFAGLAAGVAGLAVLAIVCAGLALYDAWAVRRQSMARVAAVSDRLALPLTVGRASAGLSLGLGDLVLPAALVAAAVPHGWAVAAAGALGVGAGFVLLAWQVRRTDIPGLPFLCGGGLAGVAAGLAAPWLS